MDEIDEDEGAVALASSNVSGAYFAALILVEVPILAQDSKTALLQLAVEARGCDGYESDLFALNLFRRLRGML